MLYTKTKQRANNRITNLNNIVRWLTTYYQGIYEKSIR